MLRDLGSDHLLILLIITLFLSPLFCSNKRMFFTLTLTALLEKEHCSLFFQSLLALLTSLALNVAKSSTPVGGINGQPQAWWSPKVKDQVSESRRAIAAAHRSDEDCQAYISVSRNASSGIVKTKAEARQAIC